MRKPSLVVLQGAFTAINLLGIYRWANFLEIGREKL